MKQVEEVLRLLKKYDSSYSYNAAQRQLDGVTKAETESWMNHPCTLSLIASLDGDVCDLVSGFLEGQFTSETSTDGTAQLQAKARGMAQAYHNMLERIYDIKELRLEEELDES